MYTHTIALSLYAHTRVYMWMRTHGKPSSLAMVSVWPIVRFVSSPEKKSLRSKSIEPSEKRAFSSPSPRAPLSASFFVVLFPPCSTAFQTARSLPFLPDSTTSIRLCLSLSLTVCSTLVCSSIPLASFRALNSSGVSRDSFARNRD